MDDYIKQLQTRLRNMAVESEPFNAHLLLNVADILDVADVNEEESRSQKMLMQLRAAVEKALKELGAPDSSYPAPVAAAQETLTQALAKLKV